MSVDNLDRCRTMVRRVNECASWGLTDTQQESYAQRLHEYVREGCSDTQLRRMVSYFHDDHAVVDALRNQTHPNHEVTWRVWVNQIRGILAKEHLDWSSDTVLDRDDLAQVAQTELARSLTNFGYSSHFATWAYRVIVDSVKRRLRDSRARKRAGRPDSLEQLEAAGAPVGDIAGGDYDHPTAITDASELRKLIEAVLRQQKDTRLTDIFRLWAMEDQSVEVIGQVIGLHPSRVRALLVQVRALLRNAPEIRAWIEDPDNANFDGKE